ncbi:hypothetical protein ACOMHN_014662 [Nucella lapillus]
MVFVLVFPSNPNLPRNQTSDHGGKVHNRFAGLRWPKYDKTTQQYMQMSRRPAVRHHYRGQKLAMWLDLIPKINVADGSDPTSHLLNNHNNQTTFDDFHRLLPTLGDEVFPTPPPIPPLSPTLSLPPDNPLTTSMWNTMGEDNNNNNKGGGGGGVRPSGGGGDSHYGPRRDHDKPENDDVTSDDVVGVTSNSGGSTVPAQRIGETHGAGGGMGFTNSLSITVAVGCTLLFLNLLIFAAVYYQRVRIRKLRQEGRRTQPGHTDEEDPDEVKLNRKLEREARRTFELGGPETDSLMSEGGGGFGGGGGGGASYAGAGGLLRGVGCEDSPGRDYGGSHVGGGGGSQAGTLGRRSPPGKAPSGGGGGGGTLSRSSADTPTGSSSSYSYAPVPTHATSPLHRPQHHPQHHPQYHHQPPYPAPPPSCNSTSSSSSLPPYPASHLHHHPPPPAVPLNTFSNNVNSLGRASRGLGAGGLSPRPGGPAGVGSEAAAAADSGLYRSIHRPGGGGPPPSAQGREGGVGSANNAITIV